MIVAGCDIGSTTAKAVVMKDHSIAAYSIMECMIKPEETAYSVMEEAVKKAGLSSLEELDYVVGTGYGRRKIPFADDNISEITCHGVGAYWLRNPVRTVIDIGGQDLKIIGLDDRGRVFDFVMNDKCAAGTGRFLENMARALRLTLDELSNISLNATKNVPVSSVCGIFAETEVITLLNEGETIENIAKGIHDSITTRLVILVRRVGAKKEITLAGGCALNEGLIASLEEKLGVELVRLDTNPQIVGAIGAALLAAEKLEEGAL